MQKQQKKKQTPPSSKKKSPRLQVQKGLRTEFKKKYQRQRQTKGRLKKANKKAAEWLKNAGYLETDDLEMVDYNNDICLDDIQNVNYNNDTQFDELDSDPEQIAPKNISTQKTAKRIMEKYRNLKRKGQLVNYS